MKTQKSCAALHTATQKKSYVARLRLPKSEQEKILPLQAITVLPKESQSPQGLFVGLHGWGANAQDLAALAPFLDLPNYQLLFPNAPFPHPYASAGRMWYGFPSNYGFQSQQDFQNHPDLVESRQQLVAWLQSLEEATDVPLSRTVLAGFSQGGAMTLEVGLRLPLAALLILSGYLHAPVQLEQPQTPPVLVVHGRQDSVVPLRAAHNVRDSLTALGISVQYHELDMGHEVQPIVLEIMQSFIGETVLSLDRSCGKNLI